MTYPGIRVVAEGPLRPLRERWAAPLTAAIGGVAPGPPGPQLFLEQREDLTVLLDSRTGLESVATHHAGLVARGPFPGGRSVFASDPDPDDAADLVRAACAGQGPSRPPASRASARGEVASAVPPRFDPRLPAAWLTRIDADVRRVYPAAALRLRWVGADQCVAIARPGQRPVFDRRRGTRLRAEVRLHRGDRTATSVVERVLPRDDDAVPALLPEIVAALTQRIEPLLRARPAPGGATAVVFAPAIAGVLVHELAGHALEADRALAGSWLAGRQGDVADAGLVVIDDPRRGRMGWRFDDEGEPARPTVLVREGGVRGWLVDQRTATAARRRPSGHGRRSSFREPVRPRMGCTFVAAGTLGAEEVAEGTTGVYVRRMEVAQTDPVRGHAVFRVTDADRIEQGRVMVALHPHLLVVEGVAALTGIDRVGDDLGFDACVGTCHGHAQPLAVSVGAPTIRLRLASVVS